MKKLFALILAACLLALAACGATEKAEDTPDPSDAIVGGWTRAGSPELSGEALEIFEKAMNDYGSSEYEGVALLATQVVAGMNYRFLGVKTVDCGTCVTEKTYCVITVYKDLQGNARVTDIIDTDNYAGFCEDEGCWFKPASAAMTEELRAAFDKAADKGLTPVALAGEQAADGTNYRVICEDGSSYVFATLSVDPDGNAKITETKPLSPLE